MQSKPVGDDDRLTATKNVDRLASFQIHDDRSVPVAPRDSPIIDSKNDRGLLRRRTSGSMEDAQHGVTADPNPQMGGKPTSRRATQREAKAA
jgi:hypothetical protein